MTELWNDDLPERSHFVALNSPAACAVLAERTLIYWSTLSSIYEHSPIARIINGRYLSIRLTPSVSETSSIVACSWHESYTRLHFESYGGLGNRSWSGVPSMLPRNDMSKAFNILILYALQPPYVTITTEVGFQTTLLVGWLALEWRPGSYSC